MLRMLILIMLFFFSSAAQAQNVSWLNPEQMTLLSRLGNAFSAVRNCNLGVGDNVIA
ncbi:MAG: hypothetical protein JWN93_2323, partial [Hyphomicrobiales bacterium]|nr:hypothetical protein [Hyphomicrobiales bacterium]